MLVWKWHPVTSVHPSEKISWAKKFYQSCWDSIVIDFKKNSFHDLEDVRLFSSSYIIGHDEVRLSKFIYNPKELPLLTLLVYCSVIHDQKKISGPWQNNIHLLKGSCQNIYIYTFKIYISKLLWKNFNFDLECYGYVQF